MDSAFYDKEVPIGSTTITIFFNDFLTSTCKPHYYNKSFDDASRFLEANYTGSYDMCV